MKEEELSFKDIAKTSISGGVFSFIAQGASTFIGIVSNIILARLLLPQDFGIVGLAHIYVVFIDTISTFGLNMQLIRMDHIGDKEIGTNFWLRMLLKFVSIFLTLLLIPILKMLYTDRLLLPAIVLALTFISVLKAMYLPLVAVLKHRMQFNRLILLGLISSIMQAVVAPLLAYLGMGVWSLVLGLSLVDAVVFWVGIWLFRRPWNPVINFDKHLAKEFIGFGWVVVFNKQLTYALDQFDDFWAGSSLGNAALGYYSKAFSLSRAPRAFITAPVGQFFFSAYSRLQKKRSALSKSFLIANSIVIRLNMFFSLLLFLGAPEFVLFLLGERWMPIVPVFRLMLLYSFIDPLVISAGYLLLALGYPKLQMRTNLIQAAVFIPLVIILANLLGIRGIAIAADIMIVIGVINLFRYANKFVDFSIKEMFLVPILGAIVAGCVGWLYKSKPILSTSSLHFFSMLIFTSILYVVILVLLEWKSFQKLINIFKRLYPNISVRIPFLA